MPFTGVSQLPDLRDNRVQSRQYRQRPKYGQRRRNVCTTSHLLQHRRRQRRDTSIATSQRPIYRQSGRALQEPGRAAAPLPLRLHLVLGAQVLVQVGPPTEHPPTQVAARLAGVHRHVAAVGVDVAVTGAAQLTSIHCNRVPAQSRIRGPPRPAAAQGSLPPRGVYALSRPCSVYR